MIIIINVTQTYLPDRDKLDKYIDRIYTSGWITNNGNLVQELQSRLEEYLGVKNVLLVANGTLALQISYKLLELRKEVITTPFSFVATTSSLVWEGLTPVFADIDENTLCLDSNKIEEHINDNTSGIVGVHVFGNGCDVEEIDKLSKKYGFKVIYDAAHAFNIKYKSESILNYGDISILSFHATKIFHTIEGGALIINNDELYEKAKHMINFGITGPEKIKGLGINGKMNEFEAAMGLCILDDMDEIIYKRKNIYHNYLNELKCIEQIRFQTNNKYCSRNYSYFPIIFNEENDLIRVKSALESQNIYPRRYFYPSLDNLGYVYSEKMSISNDISKKILCIPIFESLENSDQREIISIIKENVI